MSKSRKRRLSGNPKRGPKFTARQRLEIGLKCLYSNDPYIADSLAVMYHCSRSHVFNCRRTASEFIDSISDEMITGGCFVLDQKMIQAMIITLTMACHSSLEGIQLFFEMIFGYHISIGKASETISRYAETAEKIVMNDDYSNVRIMASDEIYMPEDAPILVSIDPESTAVLLMKPEKKLSAELWAEALNGVNQYAGLNPEVAVNDSGSALMKGIPMAFKDIRIQPDIFHTEIDLGYELSKFRNYIEALITEEQKLNESLSGKKIHRRTVEKLKLIKEELEEVLPVADEIFKSYEEIKKEFGFTGCRYDEAVHNATEKLAGMLGVIPSLNEEITRRCKEDPEFGSLPEKEQNKRKDHIKTVLTASRKWRRYNSLRAAVHRLEKRVRKEGIFGFLERLEKKFKFLSQEHGVPEELILEAYRLHTAGGTDKYESMYDTLFEKYWISECEDCLDHVLSDIDYLVTHTIRASSLVENTNHKIRPYIQMKKKLSKQFCCLLQLFLNTKVYRRSVKGRAGKSPLELLTGKKSPPFLELLGLV